MTSQLKIVQYNVHTSEDIVMAPLLADSRISEFSVLAVQELWCNSRILTTHTPSLSAFHLFSPPSNDASVCFFVNKSLNLSSYTSCFPTPKNGSLRLRSSTQGGRDIMILHVYRTGNLAPTSLELQPTNELLPLDTHQILFLSMQLFPMILLTMYCLGTSTSITPTVLDPESDAIVPLSFFYHFKSSITINCSCPQRPSPAKKMVARARLTLYFLHPNYSNTLTACC
jgi:hypothetical protein